jgi:hypothetical protein
MYQVVKRVIWRYRFTLIIEQNYTTAAAAPPKQSLSATATLNI